MSAVKSIGILGAGKLGITVAQLALEVGYEVYIAGSGSPDDIRLSVQIIAPGAVALNAEEVVERADMVILAIPLSKFRELDPTWFDGKLVIDSMNYWYEVDGPLEDIIDEGKTTSQQVQRYLSGATVVKALNHMGYHHLRDAVKLQDLSGRKAIAIASDNLSAAQKVSDFVDKIGFDPLIIGKLADSRVLETGQVAFGANVDRDQLRQMIG